MVLLISERKNKCAAEVSEILINHGANHISEKSICENGGKFTFINLYKKSEILASKIIVVYFDDNERFSKQSLPETTIGICEENNLTALENFKYNNSVVITCGTGSLNTISISSINQNSLLATLQRSIIDIYGNVIFPAEFKIRLSKSYSPYSVMVATAVLLLNGITPQIFWISEKFLPKILLKVVFYDKGFK